MPHESGSNSAFVGVCIELLGDLLTVVGLTGQRLATLRAESASPARPFRPCYDPHWIVALLVYAVGQLLELVALGYASESTVVATGTLTLLFNAFASVWVFGEDFAWLPRSRSGLRAVIKDWDGFNLALLVCGSVLTVWFSPLVSEHEEETFNAAELVRMWFETPFVYFSFLASTALVVFTLQACRKQSEPQPFRLAFVLAVLASFSVTMSKVVTELFSRASEGETGQFSSFGSVVMLTLWLFSLVAQLAILNIGLRDYEQSVFVPLSETMGATFTILAGILYFKTYRDFDGAGSVAGFVVGVCVLVVGLFLSAQRQSPSKAEIQDRWERQSPRFAGPALVARAGRDYGGQPAYVVLDQPLLERQPPRASALGLGAANGGAPPPANGLPGAVGAGLDGLGEGGASP